MVKRGFDRRGLLETPYDQVLFEWDAAMYNEYVSDTNSAIAELAQAISNAPAKTSEQKEHRRDLLAKRRKLNKALKDRVQLFWFGRPDDVNDGDNRIS